MARVLLGVSGGIAAYKALEQHYQSIKDEQLKDLFAADSTRGTSLTLEAEGIYLDYSK